MISCVISLSPQLCWADKDVTSYILNPSFETNGTEGWTVSNLSSQTNSSFAEKSGTVYLEKWTSTGNSVGSASVSQALTYLPAGNYRLTVAAQNIQENSPYTAQTGATIFAGSVSTTVTTANDYTVDFSTASSVSIGFKAVSATGNWISVDHFRLTYLSPNFALLATAVTDAKATITTSEKSSKAGIQPTIKTALETAIAKAEVADSTASTELTNISFELAEAHRQAAENMDQLVELRTLNNQARYYANGSRDIAEIYLAPVQTAYNEAIAVLNFEKEVEILPLKEQLQVAYNNAVASYEAKKSLKSEITSATKLVSDDKVGVETLTDAINTATAVRDRADATPEDMNAAQATLQDAVLYFRVQNATGSALAVKTLKVIQGATEIFGRASFSGGTAKEKGFCYSETPEPTIFDNRTSFSYSNNGDIYAMQGLKPATVYYVRAYAISSGYKVSYGDVVKVPTLPKGTTIGTYDESGPDETTNARIRTALQDAIDIWNNVNSLDGLAINLKYSPGTPTADCSYGGWMRIGENSSYQRTGTMMHEMLHGAGVIPGDYGWNNSIYRQNGSTGYWLGPRVDRVIQFLENDTTAHLNGDNQHMWPYGINGANEDTGDPMLYRANGLIIQALVEDGLISPGQDFAHPAYSFVQDDDTKYYIKNESSDRGLTTSYLRQTSASAVRFREMTADEVFANDSCAWYITFNPATCYYTFKNAATGRYLVMSSAGSVTASTNTSNSTFQMLGARAKTTVDGFTFADKSYWVVASSGHKAMQATTTSASGTTFNHKDEATTQRWLFLPGNEVKRFAVAQGETIETPKKYLLTYQVDGVTVQSDSVEVNTQLVPREEPKKDGYIFSGWSEIPATMPAHDVVITGSFISESILIHVNNMAYRVIATDPTSVTLLSVPDTTIVTVPASIQYQDKTYSVAALADSVFCDHQRMKSVKIPASVKAAGKNLFANNPHLAAIIWDAPIKMTQEMAGNIPNNPNLLFYAANTANALNGVTNVINSQTKQAEQIVLSDANDGNDFYCPEEFTASSISYTHDYQLFTETGKCQGWETLALPFDVAEITHESNGVITPFGALQRGREFDNGTKPFWLYEYTTSGTFAEAESVKANVPYILSMPNEAKFLNEYILAGKVTFKGTNATVKPTLGAKTVKSGNYSFTPCYQNEISGTVYLLNVEKNYDGNPKGSVFVKNNLLECQTRPFEAYFQLSGSAGVKAFFSIFDELTDGIRLMEPAKRNSDVEYYQLDGMRRDKLQRGFNIVRTPDGKTQKALVK